MDTSWLFAHSNCVTFKYLTLPLDWACLSDRDGERLRHVCTSLTTRTTLLPRSNVRAHRCVRTASGPGSPRGQPAWGGGCDPIINSACVFDPIATASGSDTIPIVTYYCERECPFFSRAFRLRFARVGGCEYFETTRHYDRLGVAETLGHQVVCRPRLCPSDLHPHY